MLTALLQAAKQQKATDAVDFPDLPTDRGGLPKLTREPCLGSPCRACEAACPTGAITISGEGDQSRISLDRGLCITCGACMAVCPTSSIVPDPSTRTIELVGHTAMQA